MNTLLIEILQWMKNNAYRRASFDRLIGIIPSASTYDQLYQLINENPMLFRTANIKGGLPGLAVLDDIDVGEALISYQHEQEEALIVPTPVQEAPLVTSSMIDSEIEYDYYRNLGSALKAPDGSPTYNTTLCVLVLRNGFVIVGKSACVHSENFNEETGKRLAREDAIRQIGPFMGWREADKRLAF